MDTPTTTDRLCASAERCRAYNPANRQPAYVGPAYLCDPCLTAAERDVRTLVYDYVDLAQLQTPVLSQALDAQPRGKAAPPMPLNGAAEALQAEIHHVLTTWETEIRAAAQLADPPTGQRPGAEVQRAVTILAPRLRQLAQIEAVVYPTGCEDEPADMCGWQAIHHLQQLHQRARAMLGRTHRTTQLPGTCTSCGLDELHRDEPRYEADPCDVYCRNCDTTWTHNDYQQYVTMLVWPTRTPA